jgi:hypothetical protein
MFLVVSVMVMPDPGLPVAGDDIEVMSRSGPTSIDRGYVLLVSEISGRISSPSALATIYQVPTAVLAGIVTVVDPELLAPAASEGTLRLPNRVSDGSIVLFADK